jgi:amino acid transporter
MKKDIKSMDKEDKNPLGGPTIILMGVGAILSVALFYFMFKYADQGNTIMVILTALLIVVVSFATMKGLAYISKRKF